MESAGTPARPTGGDATGADPKSAGGAVSPGAAPTPTRSTASTTPATKAAPAAKQSPAAKPTPAPSGKKPPATTAKAAAPVAVDASGPSTAPTPFIDAPVRVTAATAAAATVTPTPTAAPVAAPAPAASPRPVGPRRARLLLTRLDPWSVMKTAFMISISIAVVLLVATGVLWWVLDVTGVFAAIGRTVNDIAGTSTTSFDFMSLVSFSRVLGLTLVLAAVEIVLGSALATLFAFLYNLSVGLTGGLEVTLSEDS